MVPPVSHRVSRVPWYSGSSPLEIDFRLPGSHRLWQAFPGLSANQFPLLDCPQPQRINPLVWPLPRSLATTSGISVDFSSSPYLDVSVQAVPRVRLFDSTHADRVLLCRVSPFGNLRVKAYVQLTAAYRSLSRPSSAPDAKAFPLRSFQLDLSNHLLILKVELCRQFNRIFEIVIVTHLYDVPQLKLKIRSSVLSNKRPLCCLAYHFFITLFSFQGSIFQLLLQPDLKICLTPGLQIQRQMSLVWWARVGSNHRPYDYQSYALAS